VCITYQLPLVFPQQFKLPYFKEESLIADLQCQVTFLFMTYQLAGQDMDLTHTHTHTHTGEMINVRVVLSGNIPNVGLCRDSCS